MLNQSVLNNQIRQFKALDIAAIETIQDSALRKRALKLKKKQGGFTLLELLVVIAIVAVLGGLAIGAFGDKTAKAAKSTATNSLASLDSAVRGFQATTGVLPSDVDTLVCANPSATALATPVDYGGASDLPGVGGGMGAKMNGKLGILNLPVGMVNALTGSGIGALRYGLVTATDSSCDNLAGTAITAPLALTDVDFGAGFNAASPGTFPNGPLAEADIPNRGFDYPVAGGSNRGRAFEARFGVGTTYLGGASTVPVQVWNRGTSGGNNIKVGANEADVLVALGVGNNSTILTDAANGALASAAYYADMGKDKYGRYLMLVKVGSTPAVASTAITQADIDAATATALSKAKFITMVDPRGDFLDEEYAEATGQKQ